MSEKTIKSVRRVFEILELFDEEQAPLAAKDIARRLKYPLTSAHALLKSMHELGYADFSPDDWTYTPSQTLVRRLDWVREYLDRETQLLEFMGALNEETQETINLSRMIGNRMKIIHGLECKHAVGVSVQVGTLMPLAGTLTGLCAMASFDRQTLDRYLEAEEAAPPPAKVLKKIRSELEAHGTAMQIDLFIKGIGAVCLPIHGTVANDVLVLGVVGPSERIVASATAHHESLRKLSRQYGVKTWFRLKKR